MTDAAPETVPAAAAAPDAAPDTGPAPDATPAPGATPAAAPATGSPPVPGFAQLRAALPPELRDHTALAPYTSLEGLARSHVAAQKMIGKRIADASPEELARFDARHGRPETPEGYEFPAPEEGEAAEGYSPELAAAARDWFFEAGLTRRQAGVLHGKWAEFAAAQRAEGERLAEAAREEAEAALRREWGGDYDRRAGAAARAAAEFGGDDLAEYLEETGLGNDPRLVRAFARIAELVGEDGLAGSGGSDFSPGPEAARAEIARVMASPAYFDAHHPEHAATVERMTALFATAYPEIEA